MKTISEQIIEASNKTSIRVKELTVRECNDMRAYILKKYTRGLTTWPSWIWEHVTDYERTCEPGSWTWIAEFLGESKAIVMFHPSDETKMFEFASGPDMIKVLMDCYEFEFYVTNSSTEFFITFDHHDYLTACGAARSWLCGRIGAQAEIKEGHDSVEGE